MDVASEPPRFFVVEKGIPLPDPQRIRRGPGMLKYPWDKLEVDDSMLVPDRDTCRAASIWARTNGRTFVTRQMKEKPYPIRVWRIA